MTANKCLQFCEIHYNENRLCPLYLFIGSAKNNAGFPECICDVGPYQPNYVTARKLA